MSSPADSLIENLGVIDENIVIEAVRQPRLFIDAARYHVERMRLHAQAVAELEAFTSQFGIEIRNKPSKDGERRTEGYVKARVLSSPRYRVLKDKVELTDRKQELARYIVEAYRQRLAALKIIAEANAFEASKDTATFVKEQQERRLVRNAAELHRQRRSVNQKEREEE